MPIRRTQRRPRASLPKYGPAWDKSTVPRRNPSPLCPQGVISGGSQGGSALYVAEYEYKGVWRLISRTVSPQQDAVGDATIYYTRHWIRRWRPMRCGGGIPGGRVPGRVFSNDGLCYQTLLFQFFWFGGRYRFSFKRHVYVLGAGSGFFPQLNTLNCGWSHKTYQCTNFFGDGFRWRPYA